MALVFGAQGPNRCNQCGPEPLQPMQLMQPKAQGPNQCSQCNQARTNATNALAQDLWPGSPGLGPLAWDPWPWSLARDLWPGSLGAGPWSGTFGLGPLAQVPAPICTNPQPGTFGPSPLAQVPRLGQEPPMHRPDPWAGTWACLGRPHRQGVPESLEPLVLNPPHHKHTNTHTHKIAIPHSRR